MLALYVPEEKRIYLEDYVNYYNENIIISLVYSCESKKIYLAKYNMQFIELFGDNFNDILKQVEEIQILMEII